MQSSILRRVAVSAALVALAFVSATAASADVTGVADNGTSDVTVSYTLDGTDLVSESRPDTAEPCASETSGSYSYTEATLTVSESGEHDFTDVGVDDGFAAVYDGPAPSPLDTTCVAAVDDGRTIDLEAGTQYTLALTSSDPEARGEFAFRIVSRRLGTVTVSSEPEGVSLEQGQAACEPGGEVPEGYELREGTSRNDTVRGTEGNDVLRGLGGNDTLIGLGGDDILCGGAGNDSLQGGQGEDFLFGGPGNDDLAGGAGDDVLSGAAGNDLLDGGGGSDVGLDTQGSNTFRSIESRTLEPVQGGLS